MPGTQQVLNTDTSYYSGQFSSVAQSCPTLCDLVNRSTPGLPVHHQLPEFTQTHVHRVGDAIQPSHPLSSSFPPAFNLSTIRVFPNEPAVGMGLFISVPELCLFLPSPAALGWGWGHLSQSLNCVSSSPPHHLRLPTLLS